MRRIDRSRRAGLEPWKVPPDDPDEQGDPWRMTCDLRDLNCYRDMFERRRVVQCR
jgi:hypothetical protein